MEALEVKTNQQFNFLTIIQEAVPSTINGKRPKRRFLCECVCGKRLVVRLDNLRTNRKSSCGCQRSVPVISTGNSVEKHGLAYEPLYKVWKSIRNRCYCVTSENYFRYGGRGISMCVEWYLSPVPFFEWSFKNGYVEGLELDRIDNNEGYSPNNCRFTTSEINNNNKRNNKKYLHNGVWLTLPQISRQTNLGFPTLYRRINENKLTLEEALSIPLHGKCKKDRVLKCKMSARDVLAINNSDEKWRDLAKQYKISQTTVWRIKTGQYLYGHLLKNRQAA